MVSFPAVANLLSAFSKISYYLILSSNSEKIVKSIKITTIDKGKINLKLFYLKGDDHENYLV